MPKRKWQHFFASVYAMSFVYGSSLAALRFMLGTQLPMLQLIRATSGTNKHREQSSEPYMSPAQASDFLVKQELLPVTNYLPDIEKIKKNGNPVIIAVSEWSLKRKTWYAAVAQILAAQLGCELVTFPGHHGSFMDKPEEWASVLRNVLHKCA